MAEQSRSPVLIDTSVLLNFLAVDRASLLSQHPRHRFLVTDHVRAEITDQRPERLAFFDYALKEKLLEPVSVSKLSELEVFGKLIASGRLGIGECAAAALAIVRCLPLATDDGSAKGLILRTHPTLVFLDTPSIMRDLVAAGRLSIVDANSLKADLQVNHRFKMNFDRFE